MGEGDFMGLMQSTYAHARRILWKNVLEDLTNKKFIQSCRSLFGEGNGEPLLSMVTSEGTPV